MNLYMNLITEIIGIFLLSVAFHYFTDITTNFIPEFKDVDRVEVVNFDEFNRK